MQQQAVNSLCDRHLESLTLTTSRAEIWLRVHTYICSGCLAGYLDYLKQEDEMALVRRIVESYPLPLDRNWHGWMWTLQESVDRRRQRCQHAVMVVLSLAEVGNPLRLRDTLLMVAKRVWETRFNEEWEQ